MKVFLAALRSYQEAKIITLKKLSYRLKKFAKAYSLDLNKRLNSKDFEEILVEEYGYTIENDELTQHKELNNFTFCFLCQVLKLFWFLSETDDSATNVYLCKRNCL